MMSQFADDDTARAILHLLSRRQHQHFLDRPLFLSQSARNRWRLVIDRLILAAPIVPREEDSLHSLVVLEALAVGVGQSIKWLPSTTPNRHTSASSCWPKHETGSEGERD